MRQLNEINLTHGARPARRLQLLPPLASSPLCDSCSESPPPLAGTGTFGLSFTSSSACDCWACLIPLTKFHPSTPARRHVPRAFLYPQFIAISPGGVGVRSRPPSSPSFSYPPWLRIQSYHFSPYRVCNDDICPKDVVPWTLLKFALDHR